MKQFFILLLSILLLSSGCKKEKFKTVTIYGETFGCQVNGKNFIPDDWDYGNNISPINIAMSAPPTYNANTLRVEARRKNEYVQIFVNPPLTKGRHELKFNTQPWPIYDPPKDNGIYVIKNPRQEYITNDVVGGYVDLIEIDTLTNKVYGTFEFTGTDRNTGKQVHVINGVFKNF